MFKFRHIISSHEIIHLHDIVRIHVHIYVGSGGHVLGYGGEATSSASTNPPSAAAAIATSKGEPLHHSDVTTKEEENELMEIDDSTENICILMIQILVLMTTRMPQVIKITRCSSLHRGILDFHKRLVDREEGYLGAGGQLEGNFLVWGRQR